MNARQGYSGASTTNSSIKDVFLLGDVDVRKCRKYNLLFTKSANAVVKILLLALSLIYPSLIYADPHYVQALHPYWGHDERFIKYLDQFEGGVNVEVNMYEGSKDPDVGSDWYIYIYVVREEYPLNFSVDISCPNNDSYDLYMLDKEEGQLKPRKVDGVARIYHVSSDPIRKNKLPNIENGRIVWPLDVAGGPQGMWFYSESPPRKRGYQIIAKGEVVKSGAIDGPSCEEKSGTD